MKGCILSALSNKKPFFKKRKLPKYFTNMKEVFDAIGNIQNDYNWLITNYECNCHPDKRIPFNKQYVWITGEELTDIVRKNDIQFIWGVFSAFSKEIALDDILKHDLPYADGYTGFWIKELSIQHPIAELEIVPWDSSLVLLISRHEDIIKKFREYYEESEDLETHNNKYK